MNTTLQIRIDAKAKAAAKKVFKDNGLDISSGIKLYLAQVARTKEIPFEFFTFDNLPEKKKKQIVREAQWALKHGKRYDSIEEAHRDIMEGNV